jgi:hypothetical protein
MLCVEPRALALRSQNRVPIRRRVDTIDTTFAVDSRRRKINARPFGGFADGRSLAIGVRGLLTALGFEGSIIPRGART